MKRSELESQILEILANHFEYEGKMPGSFYLCSDDLINELIAILIEVEE